MFELFTGASANGRRPVVMLEECGLEFKLHKVDFASGELQKPLFLQLNPQGAVPVLVHEDSGKRRVIPQSGAILLYLADLTGRFLEDEKGARYHTLSRFFTVQTDIAAASSAIYQASIVPTPSPANDEFYRARFGKLMSLADGWLSESAYIAGNEITIADFALVPIVSQRASLLAGLAVPRLLKWLQQMSERPATQRGLSI